MKNEPSKLLRECTVSGRLSISSEDAVISVEADQQQVKVVIPAEIRFSLKSFGNHRRFVNDVLQITHRIFAGMGVRIELHYAGKYVALIGKGSKPGLTSKFSQLEPVELKFLPLLSALIRQRSVKIARRISG